MNPNWHILLVEDNPDHAELVRRSLEGFPAIQLFHLEDGEVALDYLFGRGIYAERGRFPPPDLVLLDLRLPRVDGLEVLRLVQQHPPLAVTPIVVLTTSDAERDVAAAFEYHASHFLTKPVDVQRLGRLLYDLGYGRSAGPESPPPGRSLTP
jgi:CheY-like chemotaxis protein